jgi:hypothetical protein
VTLCTLPGSSKHPHTQDGQGQHGQARGFIVDSIPVTATLGFDAVRRVPTGRSFGVHTDIVEDVWRMGQGTMTGTCGPSRSTSIPVMTSVNERDKQVLKRRLLEWHARGQGFKSPQLHCHGGRISAGQRNVPRSCPERSEPEA